MMTKLSAEWQVLVAKTNALSLRERAIIAVAASVLLLGIFDQLMMRPWLHERTSLTARQQTLSAENAKNVEAISSLEKRLANDPNQALKDEIAKLQQRRQQLDLAIARFTDGMIAPERMPALLGHLLSERSGLKVESIRTLPAQKILTADKNNPNAPSIYRHDLKLHLQGSFTQVQTYLRSIEALPSRMVWDEMSFSVAKYPHGELTLALHTLSAREELIRVSP